MNLFALADIRAKANRGWERSVLDREVLTVETDEDGKVSETKDGTNGEKPKEPAKPKNKKKLPREGQAGDPRFLSIKADVVKQMRELLGLDKLQQGAGGSGNGQSIENNNAEQHDRHD